MFLHFLFAAAVVVAIWLAEIFFIPHFFSLSFPPLGPIILATVSALLSLRIGFPLILFWGMFTDFVLPPVAASGLLVALLVFAATRVARVLLPWDEFARDVASLAVGFAAFPGALLVSAIATRMIFGVPIAIPVLSDLFSDPARTAALTALAWLVLVAWFSWRRHRAAAESRLHRLN